MIGIRRVSVLLQRRPGLNVGVNSLKFKSGQMDLIECAEGRNGNGEVALMWMQRG